MRRHCEADTMHRHCEAWNKPWQSLALYVILSETKNLLADYTLYTVIPREHSDRGNLLAGYALSTRVVAGRL